MVKERKWDYDSMEAVPEPIKITRDDPRHNIFFKHIKVSKQNEFLNFWNKGWFCALDTLDHYQQRKREMPHCIGCCSLCAKMDTCDTYKCQINDHIGAIDMCLFWVTKAEITMVATGMTTAQDIYDKRVRKYNRLFRPLHILDKDRP